MVSINRLAHARPGGETVDAPWLTHRPGRLGRLVRGRLLMDGVLRLYALNCRFSIATAWCWAMEPPDLVVPGFNGAVIEQVNMDFSGRADLVLALVNGDGQGALQVVDLKTRGCLGSFNESDISGGHSLQSVASTEMSVVPQSDDEAHILHEHRLQLALYSLALEAIESRKPTHLQRQILPPALLLGANGRMVQLSP